MRLVVHLVPKSFEKIDEEDVSQAVNCLTDYTDQDRVFKFENGRVSGRICETEDEGSLNSISKALLNSLAGPQSEYSISIEITEIEDQIPNLNLQNENFRKKESNEKLVYRENPKVRIE